MLILVSRLQLINMKTASDFEVVVFQNKGQQSSGVGSWWCQVQGHNFFSWLSMFYFAVIMWQYQDDKKRLWCKWSNNHLGWVHVDFRFKVKTYLYDYPCLILQSLCVSIKIIGINFGINGQTIIWGAVMVMSGSRSPLFYMTIHVWFCSHYVSVSRS